MHYKKLEPLYVPKVVYFQLVKLHHIALHLFVMNPTSKGLPLNEIRHYTGGKFEIDLSYVGNMNYARSLVNLLYLNGYPQLQLMLPYL